jgi:5-methyltetrahydrofolate--homocysteine methyltransferase
MNPLLQKMNEMVLNGHRDEVRELVTQALEAGIPPERVLSEGLINAMAEVGVRFERGEFYVPEMLIAARAMQTGLTLLKPRLVQAGVQAAAKVVLGTVKGDLHDIGKSLVGMMLEGAGFEVLDLGTDVGPEEFAKAVLIHKPQLVGMSALLTTTMQNMKATIAALDELGVRSKVKVMVGGAPVTDVFAREIGADGYAADASRAVTLAKALVADRSKGGKAISSSSGGLASSVS